LPDVQGLSGGDQTGVSGTRPSALTARDESGEFRSRAVTVEHSLVANNDQLNKLPQSPSSNLGDLLLSTRQTGVRDEDTEDHLQAGDLAGGADVLEGAAVGGVDADRAEALEFDERNVSVDLGCGFAGTTVAVRSVGHSPLVA